MKETKPQTFWCHISVSVTNWLLKNYEKTNRDDNNNTGVTFLYIPMYDSPPYLIGVYIRDLSKIP